MNISMAKKPGKDFGGPTCQKTGFKNPSSRAPRTIRSLADKTVCFLHVRAECEEARAQLIKIQTARQKLILDQADLPKPHGSSIEKFNDGCYRLRS